MSDPVVIKWLTKSIRKHIASTNNNSEGFKKRAIMRHITKELLHPKGWSQRN